MTEEFAPLGLREKWLTDSGPYEGVPPHMRQSLSDWIRRVFYRQWRSSQGSSHSSFDYELLQRAERQVRFSSGISGRGTGNLGMVDRLCQLIERDEKLLLSVIDFILFAGHDRADVKQLEAVLREGGSIYKVADTSRRPRLERRVEPHLEEVSRSEMRRGGAASDLLRTAWSATLGQEPNPSEGYRNAVRAVEAAALPVVLPNDPSATLGKAIGHLAATIDSWRFVLSERRDGQPSVQTVLDLMGALWTSQYDRHVRKGSGLHIGQAEADAALPLAALLVHWFATGAIQRKP